MFGSNPQFQGQQADASWCSDVGPWTLPDNESGWPEMDPIDWHEIDKALEVSRNMIKTHADHVSSTALGRPPLATVSQQQLTTGSSLSTAHPKHRSDDTSHKTNSCITPPNTSLITPPPKAVNIARPGIQPSVPGDNPNRGVHKAVGPRNRPIPVKPDVPQRTNMPAQSLSQQNRSVASYSSTGPGRSAAALARHLIASPGITYGARPGPRPVPRYVPKPGNRVDPFTQELRASYWEIGRLRRILHQYNIRY